MDPIWLDNVWTGMYTLLVLESDFIFVLILKTVLIWYTWLLPAQCYLMLILKCIRWSYLGIGNLSTAKKPTHLKKPLPPLPSSATPSTTATAPGGNRVTTELEKNALTTIGIGAKPMKWKQFFTDYSTMKWQRKLIQCNNIHRQWRVHWCLQYSFFQC